MLLLLLGASVVGAAAPAPQQEPAPSQPPEAATTARVAALLKDLELPDRRKEATFVLGEIGTPAAALLDEALASAVTRARPDVLQATMVARQRLALGPTARAFGLPPVPLTLIADYSDKQVLLVDEAGRRLLQVADGVGDGD